MEMKTRHKEKGRKIEEEQVMAEAESLRRARGLRSTINGQVSLRKKQMSFHFKEDKVISVQQLSACESLQRVSGQVGVQVLDF